MSNLSHKKELLLRQSKVAKEMVEHSRKIVNETWATLMEKNHEMNDPDLAAEVQALEKLLLDLTGAIIKAENPLNQSSS